MSEIDKKPNDAGNEDTAKVDLTKYVPKEEFEKLSGSLKELEAKLNDANMSLLSPEYLDFLDSKKAAKAGKAVSKAMDDMSSDDLDKLTPKQILAKSVELARDAIAKELMPNIRDAINRQGATLQDVLAYIELTEVRKRHSDFKDFEDDIKKIIESSNVPLTYEQAYKQAKFDKSATSNNDSDTPSKPRGTEKPGGTGSDDLEVKDFKDASEAGEDAWNRIVGSGKDRI